MEVHAREHNHPCCLYGVLVQQFWCLPLVRHYCVRKCKDRCCLGWNTNTYLILTDKWYSSSTRSYQPQVAASFASLLTAAAQQQYFACGTWCLNSCTAARTYEARVPLVQHATPRSPCCTSKMPCSLPATASSGTTYNMYSSTYYLQGLRSAGG